MPHPHKDKSGDPAQRERFEQAARELGVELDEGKLREALRQIAPQKHHSDDNVTPGISGPAQDRSSS